MNCLMRVAYAARAVQVSERDVLAQTRVQLDLMRWEELDERQVAMETAKFYGILVPQDDVNWKFVHRTLHDYLAARFWHEKAGFQPKAVKEWNARAAYAASLGADATSSMLAALRHKESISAFIEMLSNDAPFEYSVISNALKVHYDEFATRHHYTKDERHITVMLAVDFISSASIKFLQHLAFACSDGNRTKASDTLFCYAVVELNSRDLRLSKTAYAQAYRVFGLGSRFTVMRQGGWRGVDLSKLAPLNDL